MLRLILSIAAFAALSLKAAVPYDTIAAKADRFYAQKEWRSALAMFDLMLDERSGVPATYSRALTAAGMAGDTVAQNRLTRDAITARLPIDSVFSGMGRAAIALGEPEIYVSYIERAAAAEPWLRRAADAALMRYYAWRRNGPQTIAYALKMLAGLPDNVAFLSYLAQGQLDCGNISAAESTYAKIVALQPDNYDALLYLGNAAQQQGNKKAGAEFLRRAYELKPTPYVKALLESLTPRDRR